MFIYFIYFKNNCYNIKSKSKLKDLGKNILLNFSSPWCSNAVSILHKCGFKHIVSIEKSRFVDYDENDDNDVMTGHLSECGVVLREGLSN